ncbi:common-antigen outer membrane protein [Halomonas cupida]|uniref:Common-antigen outer membrane protein n=3 Tax=Halomonas cupida TaxID=44933 RepID=A0A1M7IUP8_9GAMM|nr:common-antigen outer membrane protein [Halomonas cupida]
MPNNVSYRMGRFAWTGALLMLLAGCAFPGPQSGGSGSVILGDQQGRPLDETLSGFLSGSSAHEILNLSSSPWGANVELQAEPSYRAASGRTCRHLSALSLNTGKQQALVACETPTGWVSRRRVTALLNGTENAR